MSKLVPCPFCHEMIKADSPACPYCGSDEKTGWSEKTYLDGIDLPGDSDYDEIYEKEFGKKNGHSIKTTKNGNKKIQFLISIIVLIGFILLLLRQLGSW